VRRALTAASVATGITVWALWSPFSPSGVNEAIREEPEIIPVAVCGWLFSFASVLLLIRWVSGRV
jgi:hypothetical protein